MTFQKLAPWLAKVGGGNCPLNEPLKAQAENSHRSMYMYLRQCMMQERAVQLQMKLAGSYMYVLAMLLAGLVGV